MITYDTVVIYQAITVYIFHVRRGTLSFHDTHNCLKRKIFMMELSACCAVEQKGEFTLGSSHVPHVNRK